jgi:hypothetical protein
MKNNKISFIQKTDSRIALFSPPLSQNNIITNVQLQNNKRSGAERSICYEKTATHGQVTICKTPQSLVSVKSKSSFLRNKSNNNVKNMEGIL